MVVPGARCAVDYPDRHHRHDEQRNGCRGFGQLPWRVATGAAPSELTPQHPLGHSAVAERLTVEENTWRKQDASSRSQCLTVRRREIDHPDDQWIVRSHAEQDFFGMVAQAAVRLGEQIYSDAAYDGDPKPFFRSAKRLGIGTYIV